MAVNTREKKKKIKQQFTYCHFQIFTNLCILPGYSNHHVLLTHTFVLISMRDSMQKHCSLTAMCSLNLGFTPLPVNIPYTHWTLPPRSACTQDCRSIYFTESHRHTHVKEYTKMMWEPWKRLTERGLVCMFAVLQVCWKAATICPRH